MSGHYKCKIEISETIFVHAPNDIITTLFGRTMSLLVPAHFNPDDRIDTITSIAEYIRGGGIPALLEPDKHSLSKLNTLERGFFTLTPLIFTDQSLGIIYRPATRPAPRGAIFISVCHGDAADRIPWGPYDSTPMLYIAPDGRSVYAGVTDLSVDYNHDLAFAGQVLNMLFDAEPVAEIISKLNIGVDVSFDFDC